MGQSRKILLVDDDLDILQGLKTLLETKGYTIVTAADGDAGLALAEQEKPELVVVDMMMPHKSGFLVLEKLKSRGLASPRVIMITANEGHCHRAYAEMLGVDEYLNKPFALDDFLAAIAKHCPLDSGDSQAAPP